MSAAADVEWKTDEDGDYAAEVNGFSLFIEPTPYYPDPRKKFYWTAVQISGRRWWDAKFAATLDEAKQAAITSVVGVMGAV